ncbi:MAG: hypothetical protein HRT81_12845 [Henriciella sp.]|nr:hypothetical protein [Henriciella sp.]
MKGSHLEKPASSLLERVGKAVFYLIGYAVVFGLAGLSIWAVGTVQMVSRPEGDIMRYWYLIAFVAMEVWVVIGLTVGALRAKQGAWLASFIAFAIWVPALGLSAMQESRFHVLFDSKIDAEAAPELELRESALKRVSELESELKALGEPKRSPAAIEAEYHRYKDRPKYPTKTAQLLSELEDARAYQLKSQELANHRQTLVNTASLAAENLDAKKVGQTFTVPLIGWNVSSDFTVWVLIATMMAIKSLGPWLLFGSALRKGETASAQDGEVAIEALETNVDESLPVEEGDNVQWIYTEREDRDGNKRMVRVPKANAL